MSTNSASSQPAISDVGVDVLLRDGSSVRLRRVGPDDRDRIRRFFADLSQESRYFRFFGLGEPTEQMLASSLGLDLRALSLIAERGTDICAIATWGRESADSPVAEVAFAVADRLHGCGLGTRMLERLAELARPAGIARFEAWVLPANTDMLHVFRDSGFRLTNELDQAVCHLVLDLRETASYLDRATSRARHAATASIAPFFTPRVVAVVGASRARGKLGAEIFQAIRDGGFTGRVVPVNPVAREVAGVPAVPSVGAIDGPVDLAVIAVPAAQVEAVVDQCLARGIRALVVISAGFGEASDEGRAREARLVEKVRAAGARLIGPNCMGLINTDPATSLNASFAPTMPPAGDVAFLSQSGALGLALLRYARQLDLGISTFVSVGNKADVSGNDLIQYWADDPRTRVILLYLESFGNPRNFARIARRVARQKPVVAMKAGRSGTGARAASSHTGALASDDRVVEALFEQAGVIRTRTLEELFDVATLLDHATLPPGMRVGIVSNAGGPAILAADACEAEGLVVSSLAQPTVARLREVVPGAASVTNPVDLLASASAEDYRHALSLLLRDPNVDSVIALYVPVLADDAGAVASAIGAAAREAGEKPLLATFLDAQGVAGRLSGVPCFAYPESAARALGRAARYASWRARPLGQVPELSAFDGGRVRERVEAALARGGGWLGQPDVTAVLEAAGIVLQSARLARSLSEAIAASRDLRFPVALKAQGPTIVHKTEIGGVRLGLRDEAELEAAWSDLAGRLGSSLEGALVQAMAPDGPEMLVGAVQQPLFGPVVACGAGGVMAELVQDTLFRLTPLTDVDVAAMLDELKCVRLLRGYRGRPPADEQALRELLLRVSALVDACPAIQELDLNPVRVLPKGLAILDARLRVDHPTIRSSRRIWY
jgi:acetyl coenzyme A synthetase (ADP forming)-like protein